MNHPPIHLVAGEYPPVPGGIGDYAAVVAGALARRGVEVHVWTRSGPAPDRDPPGVAVHRVVDRWSGSGLGRLGVELDRFPGPRRLLVQHAPNSWGRRGMNLAWPRWLARRARAGDRVEVVFHEVRYTVAPGDRPIRRLLVPVQNRMARTLLRASRRAYVTIPAWVPRLRAASRVLPPVAWLPNPSGIPRVDDPGGAAAAEVRARLGSGPVVGVFGSFRASVVAILEAVLPAVLRRDSNRVALLVGRGGDQLRAPILARHPDLAGRVAATGDLDPAAVSRHLGAVDLLVQVDRSGVCCKQTSVMACLAHARAVVAADGELTEPLWRDGGFVALAASADPADLVPAIERVLADPTERDRLARAAGLAYDRWFAPDRLVDVLLGEAEPPAIPDAPAPGRGGGRP